MLDPHTRVPGDVRALFGLEVNALTMREAVAVCESALHRHSCLMVGVVNAAKMVHQRDDALLRDSLLDCDLLLADGQSVVWASRLLHRPLPERVAGIDLFEALLAVATLRAYSIYLLGAQPWVLDRLLDRIHVDYPALRVVGTHDGYFTGEQEPEVVADIRQTHPDMLFLGMPSPNKERFVATYGRSLGVGVVHGVGGSFDVLAGVTKRAPDLLQRTGLEWTYRLAQEPRRLWRRYLHTNTAFAGMTLLELIHPSATGACPAHPPEGRTLE